ncbi:hypothetical protein KY362_06685 [Candidatus Woesearchaeota archaeon]|nr:hypothetical protein [Candidatus Woesearchaeota archaeon]
MKTDKTAIIGILFCTVLTGLAQIFLKLGVMDFRLDMTLMQNYYLFLGLFLYGGGLLVMTFSFKHGELSVLYPFIALSYVWVQIISYLFIGESANMFKISAIALIILGVSLIGFGGRK